MCVSPLGIAFFGWQFHCHQGYFTLPLRSVVCMLPWEIFQGLNKSRNWNLYQIRWTKLIPELYWVPEACVQKLLLGFMVHFLLQAFFERSHSHVLITSYTLTCLLKVGSWSFWGFLMWPYQLCACRSDAGMMMVQTLVQRVVGWRDTIPLQTLTMGQMSSPAA